MKLIFLACLLLNIKLAYSLVWIGDFGKFSTWKIEHSYNDANRQVVNDPKGGNDKVLRVKYPAGSVSNKPGLMKGGTGFYVYPFGGQQVLHAVFEYDVLFSCSLLQSILIIILKGMNLNPWFMIIHIIGKTVN